LEGGFKIRGLGEKQLAEVITTNKKILNYIEAMQPTYFSRIQYESGVSDKKTLKKRLNLLVDSNKIGFVNFTSIPGIKNRIHYYKNPMKYYIQDLIDEEQFFNSSKNSKQYYYGIKPKIPLHLQFIHKNRIIVSQKHQMIKTQKRVKPYRNLPFGDKIFLRNIENRLLGFKTIQKDLKEKDRDLQKSAIDVLDEFTLEFGIGSKLHTYRFTNLQKFNLVRFLQSNSINQVSKKLNCSKATVKKIQKEFFVSNDYVDEEKITKLHDSVFGEKKYQIRNRKSLLDSNDKLQLPKFRTKKEKLLHSILPETEYV
jgi:hypothetical protein